MLAWRARIGQEIRHISQTLGENLLTALRQLFAQ
jgi:hypothetical protein